MLQIDWRSGAQLMTGLDQVLWSETLITWPGTCVSLYDTRTCLHNWNVWTETTRSPHGQRWGRVSWNSRHAYCCQAGMKMEDMRFYSDSDDRWKTQIHRVKFEATEKHTSEQCSGEAESWGLVVCVTVAPHPGQRYSRRIRSLNFTRHSSRHNRYAIFSTAHTHQTHTHVRRHDD